MNEKRILKLSIFNKSYVVATDEKDESIFSAAERVDSLLRNISRQVKSNNESKIAVLAALQLATDLAKQKELSSDSMTKLTDLIEKLEENCSVS